jgi:hypothetical protein
MRMEGQAGGRGYHIVSCGWTICLYPQAIAPLYRDPE